MVNLLVFWCMSTAYVSHQVPWLRKQKGCSPAWFLLCINTNFNCDKCGKLSKFWITYRAIRRYSIDFSTGSLHKRTFKYKCQHCGKRLYIELIFFTHNATLNVNILWFWSLWIKKGSMVIYWVRRQAIRPVFECARKIYSPVTPPPSIVSSCSGNESSSVLGFRVQMQTRHLAIVSHLPTPYSHKITMRNLHVF